MNWPSGWLFLVLFFGFVIAMSAWLYRHNPDLLRERMHGALHSDQKGWDRLFLLLAIVVFFGWLMVMGLDAVRFGWSATPAWARCIGTFLLVFSFYLYYLTFRENTYLSPVVRIQKDRGHAVVSTGPYAVVRHPMYAAFVLTVIATPLLLGSWYGLLGSLLLILLIARRAVLEERTLRQELPGYAAYMEKVRYRLVPYVW